MRCTQASGNFVKAAGRFAMELCIVLYQLFRSEIVADIRTPSAMSWATVALPVLLVEDVSAVPQAVEILAP
jgi:hypothetical protein